jgi:hypothetical protein
MSASGRRRRWLCHFADDGKTLNHRPHMRRLLQGHGQVGPGLMQTLMIPRCPQGTGSDVIDLAADGDTGLTTLATVTAG